MFYNNPERKREHNTLEEALINLERLDEDFKRIHNCLGHLVAWWGGIKEKLSDMEQEVRQRGISTYKDEAILDALRGGWNDVKERYRMYQSKVRLSLYEPMYIYTQAVSFSRPPKFKTAINRNTEPNLRKWM